MATSLIGPGGMGTSVNAQSSLQQVREMQLLQQLNSGKDAGDDAKIEKGARQFESMLLSSWLQQAEKSFATLPGADDDEDTAGKDQMISLGVQSLADAMAANGGIGIAKMISKAMHATAAKVEAEGQTEGESKAQSPAEIGGKIRIPD